MALTLTDLRDGMERQLRSVEAQQRRHGLLKDGGPTSTPRTERLQHLEPRVTQRPRHGKHMGARTDRTDASAQRQRTQRSTSRNTARSTARESVGSDTARLLDATRTAGSMKVATLRGQLKQTLRERHDAEKEVRRLAKELEKMSTGELEGRGVVLCYQRHQLPSQSECR